MQKLEQRIESLEHEWAVERARQMYDEITYNHYGYVSGIDSDMSTSGARKCSGRCSSELNDNPIEAQMKEVPNAPSKLRTEQHHVGMN